ncbi:hypothetical protein JAU75_01535 [Ochrobactrum sp. Q0168]|uniref:hypothetical protein n=1 Tax=Ochrobactrum sp. Q0168 TaxID=2793241 RepID=UPI0018EA6656|nr:hypothetical protein [Ochrobactrum sp. Q0168]
MAKGTKPVRLTAIFFYRALRLGIIYCRTKTDYESAIRPKIDAARAGAELTLLLVGEHALIEWNIEKMEWIPVVLIAFKVLVLGTAMFFAIKFHYDEDKKKKNSETSGQ